MDTVMGIECPGHKGYTIQECGIPFSLSTNHKIYAMITL